MDYLLIEYVSLTCSISMVLRVELWSSEVVMGEPTGQLIVTHEGKNNFVILLWYWWFMYFELVTFVYEHFMIGLSTRIELY